MFGEYKKNHQNLGLFGDEKKENKVLGSARCLLYIVEDWFLAYWLQRTPCHWKTGRDKHPLCLVSQDTMSSSQALQLWKLFEIVRKAKKPFGFKLSLPGENFFPTTIDDARDRIPHAMSEPWSSRQEGKSWLLLLTMAGCAWGSDVVCGGARQFLMGETEFTKRKNIHDSHQGSYWICFSSLTSGHLVLCRISFSSFCNTIVPFPPIITV